MAVTATLLDGNNVALVISGVPSVNVFSLDSVTGDVSSAYLPSSWTTLLRQNARKLFAVTTTSQRQTVQFLNRLISIGSLDGTDIVTSSSVVGDASTLVVSVNANTTLLVQLPHSIFGAASLGQSVPAAGGGGGSVVPGDLGLVPWTASIDGAVALGDVVGVDRSTGNLVRADKTTLGSLPALGVYELDSSLAPCVRVSGEVAATGGPFTAGAIVYVGASGSATTTNPGSPGENRQVIGFGTSSGDLFVAPGFVEIL